MLTTFPILTALILGLLTIIDPCTLFTSITAISYIDKEINNRRLVLLNGLMYVLGKLVTYVLLSIPFILGAQTSGIQHFLEEWGEPLLAIFILLCGILMLISGHHHHEHDHGVIAKIEKRSQRNSWFWAFVLGIFFAIAFCPHRLVYFITMIDITLEQTTAWNWLLPVVFGLGTGLPIMIIAWIISYSAVSIGKLTNSLHHFEKWFRRICAILFIGLGIYLGIHCLTHDHDGHEHHHEHETAWVISQK